MRLLTFLRALPLLALLAIPAWAEDRAVIVGINHYPYAPDSDLKGARPDALRFNDFVVKEMGLRRDQVTLLLDGEATSERILKTLIADLKFRSKPGDRVIFYFAGHGSRITDRDGDETDKLDEVLITADIKKPKSIGIIRDDDLRYIFEKFPDRRILVVIDACHSGSITRSAAEIEDAPRLLPVDPNSLPDEAHPEVAALQAELGGQTRSEGTRSQTLFPGQRHIDVWSAAAQEEVALENPSGGVFTTFFLEAVGQKRADLNRNGIVSNSELLHYVRLKSAKYCRRSKLCQTSNNGRLTPEFSGVIQRAALFETPEVLAAPAPAAPEILPAPTPQGGEPSILEPEVVEQSPKPDNSGTGFATDSSDTPAPSVDDTPPNANQTVGTVTTPSQTPPNASGQSAALTNDPVANLQPATPGAQTAGTSGLSSTLTTPGTSTPTDSNSLLVTSPVSPVTPEPPNLAVSDLGTTETPVPISDPGTGNLAETIVSIPLDPNPNVSEPAPEQVAIVDPTPTPPKPVEPVTSTLGLEDLFLPASSQEITLAMLPGTELSVGDSVSFVINTRRDGQIILFDLNPKGELFQIFPSPLSPDGAEILPDARKLIVPSALSRNGRPLRIRVTEPAGSGRLLALLVEDPLLDVAQMLPQHANLDPIPDAEAHLVELATALNRSTMDAGGARAARWHSAILEYDIAPK